MSAPLFSTFVAASFLVSLGAASGALAQTEEEAEEIIVQSTRTGRRVQDEPIRVEVINREELEEKLMMTPGNISMLVSEMGGVRVQVTSPALGASNIRMQGLSGRYTSLLADGLPLYGGSSSSLGLLQIPPTDLGQVEVIKGAASALYGSSALGGVINLISRRPRESAEGEVLANVTSRDGQDLTAYGAMPLTETWRASAIVGHHRQTRQDLDGDGWIDMPGYQRWTVRPRLFWEADNGANAYLTLGAMTEDRSGGTLPGSVAPDGRPFAQTQEARRLDAGGVAEFPLGELIALHLRGSAMAQEHDHRFGDDIEHDHHDTRFAEISLSRKAERTSWLGGLAYQNDGYRSRSLPAFNYNYETPAAFAQMEHDALENLTVAASGRVDWHGEYGTKFSPRISALYRPGDWSVRASLGSGFFAPTPFVEEIEAAGLSRLAPLSGLKAETAENGSIDVGYRFAPFEANVALFASHLHDAVSLKETSPSSVRLVNVPGVTRTQGAELLLRYRRAPFTVTGNYVYVDASEPGPAGRTKLPVTPQHTAGLVVMWEEHDRGRVGFEAYYTGEQALEDNPYRTKSRPYFELGLLGELVLGKTRVFVNAENLLNVRQSRYDSLLRRTRAADGRWTVDAWAPLEGFTVNAGVRLNFGG